MGSDDRGGDGLVEGSSSEREILAEGFLCKRSVTKTMGQHTWKRHYFVLDDRRSLAYYDSHQGTLKGQFVLTADSKVLPSQLRENCLELKTPYVTLIMQADSDRKRNAWRESLNCVIRDAMVNRAGGANTTAANKLQDARRKAREMRMPQNLGKTGRGTHTFKAGGSTFEVDTRYTLVNVIGQGAYGVVVAANDSESGNQVAIKKIRGVFDNIIDGKRILREVKLLRFLNHKNISHIIDLMRPSPAPGVSPKKFDDVYIVLDKMDTDLNRVIYSEQKLTDQHVQYLMFQLLCAVHYCTTANVIHRDLKPSNILVNSQCQLRVCDFGLARGQNATSDELTTYVVTRWYRAPELILACGYYTSAIDMWSVGCIFAELISRQPLFAGEDFLHQLRLICDVLGSPTNEDLAFMSEGSANRYLRDMEFKPRKPWREVPGLEDQSDEALDLLDKMLTFSPVKRITAYDALKHPYLKAYHKQVIKSAPEPFDIEAIESMNLTRKQLREAMMEEIRHYRGNMYDSASNAKQQAILQQQQKQAKGEPLKHQETSGSAQSSSKVPRTAYRESSSSTSTSSNLP